MPQETFLSKPSSAPQLPQQNIYHPITAPQQNIPDPVITPQPTLPPQPTPFPIHLPQPSLSAHTNSPPQSRIPLDSLPFKLSQFSGDPQENPSSEELQTGSHYFILAKRFVANRLPALS